MTTLDILVTLLEYGYKVSMYFDLFAIEEDGEVEWLTKEEAEKLILSLLTKE